MMLPHRFRGSMRAIFPLVTLSLLAGCIDAPTDATGAAAEDAWADLPVGGLVEGEVFLPPSSGQDRVETLIEVPANVGGLTIVADLALGSRYGPVDAPLQTADVLVELRGPEGDVLADAHLGAQQTEARLEAETTMDGPHTLAILSYGGSDGEANGDFVSYRAEATRTPADKIS